MPDLICFCGTKFYARPADIKRGWAKTCSKSCAAIKREYCRPNATNVDGSKVKFGKKPDYSARHTANTAKRYHKKRVHEDWQSYEEDIHPFDSYAIGQD